MQTQSAFMAAAAAVVLFVAMLLRRHDRVSLLLSALTFAFGSYAFGRGLDELGSELGPVIVQIGLAGIGPLAALTAAALVGHPNWSRRLLPALYLGTPAWTLLAISDRLQGAPLQLAIHTWSVLGVLAAATILARYPAEPDSVDSASPVRVRYLAITHTLIGVSIAIDLVTWRFGRPQVASLLVPLLYLYTGYLHLAQVRLADLRQMMGNTFALSLMALGLAGLFAAIYIAVGTKLELFLFNTFVASFALLLFFEPIRQRVQLAMDRRFVAGKLELKRTLAPLIERLAHVQTLDDVLSDLLQTIEQTDRIRASSLFLREDRHLGFQQAGSVGLPPRRRINLVRQPAWIEALENHPALLREDIGKAFHERQSEADAMRLRLLQAIMQDLDAELVLPIRTESRVLGFWTLANTNPRNAFSSSEVKFLQDVSNHLAISIENSKTFENIRARDRLVNLGEMAAGLAHEIRNPLAIIRGAIAVMEDPDTAPADMQRMIVEEIQRLDRVVGTFLDYANPDARAEPVNDLESIIRATVTDTMRALNPAAIKIEFEIAGPVPAVRANADQLERVIANLVQNAIQALGDEGTIRISIQSFSDPPSVEITVQDDGPGMDEPTLEKAFIPFFTTKERGTGLGLALCEKLVRAQGGTIELRCRPGEGTAVSIRLALWLDEGTEVLP